MTDRRGRSAGALRGLPELERFPTPEARDAFLADHERAFYSWRIVPVLALHCLVVLIAFRGAVEVARRALPGRDELAGWIALGVVVLAYGAVIRVLIRRDAVRTLRRSLCRHGVPTCLACGYDLRGQGGDDDAARRCPECGRRLGSSVRRAL